MKTPTSFSFWSGLGCQLEASVAEGHKRALSKTSVQDQRAGRPLSFPTPVGPKRLLFRGVDAPSPPDNPEAEADRGGCQGASGGRPLRSRPLRQGGEAGRQGGDGAVRRGRRSGSTDSTQWAAPESVETPPPFGEASLDVPEAMLEVGDGDGR